jgi:hypothetical protein
MSTKKDAIQWGTGFFANELIGNIQASTALAGFSEEDCAAALDLAARCISERDTSAYWELMKNAHVDAVEKGIV